LLLLSGLRLFAAMSYNIQVFSVVHSETIADASWRVVASNLPFCNSEYKIKMVGVVETEKIAYASDQALSSKFASVVANVTVANSDYNINVFSTSETEKMTNAIWRALVAIVVAPSTMLSTVEDERPHEMNAVVEEAMQTAVSTSPASGTSLKAVAIIQRCWRHHQVAQSIKDTTSLPRVPFGSPTRSSLYRRPVYQSKRSSAAPVKPGCTEGQSFAHAHTGLRRPRDASFALEFSVCAPAGSAFATVPQPPSKFVAKPPSVSKARAAQLFSFYKQSMVESQKEAATASTSAMVSSAVAMDLAMLSKPFSAGSWAPAAACALPCLPKLSNRRSSLPEFAGKRRGIDSTTRLIDIPMIS